MTLARVQTVRYFIVAAALLALSAFLATAALSTDLSYASEAKSTDGSAGIEAISGDIDNGASPEGVTEGRVFDVAHINTLQYMVMQSGEFWIAQISAEIADNEQLPAVVDLAVPQHSSVYRFNEVGEAHEFPADMEMRTEGGFDIYRTTLTNERIVVLEYTLPGSPFEQTGDGPSINVSYTPFWPVRYLYLIAALPVDSAVTDPRFEFIAEGPNGEPAFAEIFEDAQAGHEYTTQIVYRANVSADTDSSVPLVALAIFGGAALMAVIMFFFFKRGAREDDNE